MKYSSKIEPEKSKQNIEDLIAQTSPLHEYWASEQNGQDESIRITKLNTSNPSSNLFRQEPYKWEILYQSIFRELLKGDLDSIKGLKILLSMLEKREQDKSLQAIKNRSLLDENIMKILLEDKIDSSRTKKNLLRFSRILFSIFTNPYGIELKGEKTRLYEKTGYMANKVRRILNL